MLKTLFHLGVVAHYYYVLYYWFAKVELPSSFSKTVHILGRLDSLKFLTNWNVVLQTVFFTVCLLNDLLGYNKEKNPKKPSRLRKIQDVLLSCLAFPVALFISLTFWTLWTLDRELIMPKALDPYIPYWYNHAIHSNVLIFSFLELIISFRKYPSTKVALCIHQGFSFSYLVWTLILLYWTGSWVYPILNVVSWPTRILFILGNKVCSMGFYFVGKFINNLRWSKELKGGQKQLKNGSGKNKSKLKKQT